MKEIERAKTNPDTLIAELAGESGLAVIVVDEKNSLFKANNNSICEALYNSNQFAPLCEKDCGRAFDRAAAAATQVSYECHAGLECRAVSLKTEKPLVAIVGRAFTKADSYRRATTRAIDGDWSHFPPTRFFENVLLSGSLKTIEKIARRLENLSEAEKIEILDQLPAELKEQKFVPAPPVAPDENEKAPVAAAAAQTSSGEARDEAERIETLAAAFHRRVEAARLESSPPVRSVRAEAEELTAWRSLFGSLFNLSYRQACLAILKFLSQRYRLESLAWLERRDNQFESVLASGSLKQRQFKISLPADDARLFEALENEFSLELRERAAEGEQRARETIRLFPVSVGGEVQSALIVADELVDEQRTRSIAKFCHTVASEVEILRLREEVKRRSWLAHAVEKFNASLKKIDTEDFWVNLAQISAELMHAERSSLMVFDEKSDILTVKAAIGSTADRIKNEKANLGDRVARLVLQNGQPIVVPDVNKIGLPAAPIDWKYKTASFISYPFVIGERRIGVLNVTDRADGSAYGENDLELLQAIAPQVAVLIDRAALKNKAGEFEQLSVTDALTGLLNRRYLEERLSEEIKRSNRYGYPMCFMMIDVDNFKSYNDTFLHTEGDKALKIVGQVLRETLRSADVAARYGGEEFSILLPQTTRAEAQVIAERLREQVEQTSFPNRQITVSIGIASCSLELNAPKDLIDAADRALYGAKRRGKNRIQFYEDLEASETVKK